MTRHDHLDHRLPLEVRADLLAREMTVVEKCNQLTAVPPWWLALGDGTDPDAEPGCTLTQDLESGELDRAVAAAADADVVVLALGGASLWFLVRDFTVEPARVEVYLGLDSHDRQLEGAFELTGDPRLLASGDRSFFYEVGVSDV